MKLLKEIFVLGTQYSIYEASEEEDASLEKCDGYCDKTSKKIVISDMKKTDLENIKVYRNKAIRHEIIHAFMFESGFGENFEHKQFGQEETVIDWIAIQFPKIKYAFKIAECDV